MSQELATLTIKPRLRRNGKLLQEALGNPGSTLTSLPVFLTVSPSKMRISGLKTVPGAKTNFPHLVIVGLRDDFFSYGKFLKTQTERLGLSLPEVFSKIISYERF